MPGPPETSRKARFGLYEVDFRAGELRKSGRKLRLQDQPLHVLAMLLENPGEVVTREELRQKLWPGDTFVDFDHGLNNAINRLREALNDSAEAPRFIETLPRRGYRFIAEVNGQASTDSQATGLADSIEAVQVANAAEGQRQAAKPSPPPGLPRVGKFWLVLAGVCLAAGLVFGLNFGRQRFFGTGASLRIQSLAVLPLENLSGDPSQEYYADGMTDTLTTSLAQLPGIRVISRTSAMHFKGTKKQLPEIAKELGVDALVEGSVSHSNGAIHVNAQLIYAQGDRHLWAHSYDVSAAGLQAVEAEIVGAVGREIGAATSPEAGAHLSKMHSVNPEAYDLFLRAEPYYGLETREANDEAIRLLEKSVAIDDNFAESYAALATAYRTKAFSIEPEKVNEWMERAASAVQKSLSLDANLADAYVSRGYLLWSRTNGWSHERAVSDYRHALELNPNLAEAHHQLANVYNHVGLLDKADEEIKKAVALDPLNTGIRFRVGVNLLYRGNYEESLAALRDSERFLPTFLAFQTAFALQHLGSRQEAEDRISRKLKANPLDGGGSLTAMQALLAADGGNAALAERKIQEAIAKGKGYQHFHHVAYAVASAYALLDKRNLALEYLRLVADDGFPCYPLFEHDTNLNHLRNDPRFLNFLEEQKKQWEYFRNHL